MPINQWAQDDRPREKFELKGKESLSDSELLAILIGSGSRKESAVQLCQRILAASGNNLNNLGKMSIAQLTQFKGIGPAKAITIAAALEIGRRRREEEVLILQTITSSHLVFTIMHPILADLPHEEFWVLYLNNSNKVLYKAQISKGGITQTTVDIRLVFKTALEQHATAIILVHNHPSGKLQASDSDRQLTQQITTAGQYLQIKVLDHLIITQDSYLSFADSGIL